jgi:hypothetical protein
VRRLLKALVYVAGLVLLLEVAFRVGALAVGGTPKLENDGRTVVLCVGDSHTRGRNDPDNYPYHLQEILDQRAKGRYHVVNVGIPGMSTGQIRPRFARYLEYYHPAVVVHWAGINNGWHHPEGPRYALARLAEYSRVARMIQVALFYRELGKETKGTEPELVAWKGARARWHVDFGGRDEEIVTEHGRELPVDEVSRVTLADYQAMMQSARAQKIPMYLITYPLAGGYYAPVNNAVRSVSADFGVPFIDTTKAAAAAHEEDTKAVLFDTWVHRCRSCTGRSPSRCTACSSTRASSRPPSEALRSLARIGRGGGALGVLVGGHFVPRLRAVGARPSPI